MLIDILDLLYHKQKSIDVLIDNLDIFYHKQDP